MTRSLPPVTPSIEVIEAPRPAAALLHPLRRRILEALRHPDSASGLSRQFRIPRQKLNYHLRSLQKQGLLSLVEERKRGNCVERLYRASARAFVISPEALGALAADPRDVEDRFSSSYLVAVAARAIHDIGLLRTRARRAGRRLGTFTLQGRIRLATPAARKAFMEELTRELARLSGKYHDEVAPGGRSFQFLLAGYPALESRRPGEEGEGGGEKD